MKIALDAMGTDDAPITEIAGAVVSVGLDPTLRVILVGDEAALTGPLSEFPAQEQIEVVHAPDRIDSSLAPVAALRRSPNSSIGVGLGLHAAGKADAFVSAGSTGAVMAASLRLLRPVRGVDRPPVGTMFPTHLGPTLVTDAGANIDCKPHNLAQFARVGSIYMQDLYGVSRPRVGLLNVGAEQIKGTEVLQDAYRLLAGSDLNFVGNIEGRDIVNHACDVLVCDGFTGNILLKFYESLAAFLVAHLRDRLMPGDLGAEFEEAFRVFDYAEYGGAPLLGVNGVSIICHGESSPKAISAAIGMAARTARSGIVDHIARDLAS
ncbi:MAG: phosphate acyltransferase PlsX [Gemmatimonadetes bacterium]|nr:phosphate acyltransferase PlsX [Gemmatimonadota bacterium]